MPSLLPYSVGCMSQSWFSVGKVCTGHGCQEGASLGAILEGGCRSVPHRHSSAQWRFWLRVGLLPSTGVSQGMRELEQCGSLERAATSWQDLGCGFHPPRTSPVQSLSPCGTDFQCVFSWFQVLVQFLPEYQGHCHDPSPWCPSSHHAPPVPPCTAH